jgi:hypothetical protein
VIVGEVQGVGSGRFVPNRTGSGKLERGTAGVSGLQTAGRGLGKHS